MVPFKVGPYQLYVGAPYAPVRVPPPQVIPGAHNSTYFGVK